MADVQVLTKRKMSLAEFLSLPEDDASSVKYELEFGELVEVTRPTWEHNELAHELEHAIRQYVRSRGLGRVSGDVWSSSMKPKIWLMRPTLFSWQPRT